MVSRCLFYANIGVNNRVIVSGDVIGVSYLFCTYFKGLGLIK